MVFLLSNRLRAFAHTPYKRASLQFAEDHKKFTGQNWHLFKNPCKTRVHQLSTMVLCVKTVPFHHNHTTVHHLTSPHLTINYLHLTDFWMGCCIQSVSCLVAHFYENIVFQAEYFRYLSQNIAMNILRLQRITFPFRMHSETESTASFYDTHAEREIFPHFKLTSFRVIDKLVCSLHTWHPYGSS